MMSMRNVRDAIVGLRTALKSNEELATSLVSLDDAALESLDAKIRAIQSLEGGAQDPVIVQEGM